MAEEKTTTTAEQEEQTTETTATQPKATEPKEKTYTQAELDKVLSDALAKQKEKYDKEKSEAAKLAKMDKEEKEKYKEQQRIQKLEEREKAVALAELKQTAIGLLVEKKLDPTLAEILDYTSAETVKASIDKVETVIKGAISNGIDERIKASSGTPRKGGTSGSVPPAQMSNEEFNAYIDNIKKNR